MKCPECGYDGEPEFCGCPMCGYREREEEQEQEPDEEDHEP